MKTFKRFLKESILKEEINESMFVYHGTTKPRGESILKNGFDLKRAGEKTSAPLEGFSTTLNYEIAEEHAEWASEKFNEEPFIIGGTIPKNFNLMDGKTFQELLDNNSIEEIIKIAKKLLNRIRYVMKNEKEYVHSVVQ